MRVNEAKTHVMVFRRGSTAPEDVHHLTYSASGDPGTRVPLVAVEQFRFLGVPLFADQRSAAVKTMEALTAAAIKRYGAMWTRAREMGVEDYASLEKLFEACVLSVAGYAAPVFAPLLPALDLRRADAAEHLHLRFLRATLGLPSWTPKSMLYLETGRLPLRVGPYGSSGRWATVLSSPSCPEMISVTVPSVPPSSAPLAGSPSSALPSLPSVLSLALPR